MRFLVFCALSLLAGAALSEDFDEEYEQKSWTELAVQLPAAPVQANLLSFYVSPLTENRYFIDSASISVGQDGVVRYTLQVLAGGGARNVTYEGMRCETRERRIYASGRIDGSWSRFGRSEWVKIVDSAANRHHAALFLEYFCPNGVIVVDSAEAVRYLRTGGYAPGGAR